MHSRAFSRRKMLSGLVIAGSAAALAACAPAASPQPAQEAAATEVPEATAAPPKAEGGAVTLRFRTWVSGQTSPLDQAWYDWLSEHFPQDHDGSTIEFEFVPFGAEYIQKLLADSAAGSPPDLLDSSIIWARDFWDRGILLELNDYLDAVPELAPDMFYGESTNIYRSKAGSYYGIPYWGPDSQVIALNSKLFEEAGLDPQGADIETWEDFVDATKALTKTNGDEVEQAGFLVGSMRYIESFSTWMYSNGGALHDPDITQPTFNNERGAQVMQLQLDLLNTHKVSFPISPERQDTQLFLQSQAAMVAWGTWSPTYIGGNAPEGFEYWLITFPRGPQGDGPGATTWSNMMVIPKKAKYPDLSFELARYVATPPNVITRFELSNRLAPLKALYESDAWRAKLESVPQLAIVTEAAEVGGVYPFFPFFTEANDAIGTELEQVMLGEKSVEEGLAEAEARVIEVIQRRQTTGG
ncbi:MAG: extracellular solute-binding protein [Anaerolineae bacterium]|nr:extracellular solute-binding protein [Anaerolineae bacterium]